MPLAKISVRPGINSVATQTVNEGGLSDGNLIRFFQGFLQKYGGSEKLADVELGGLCRGMHAYQDIDGNQYLMLGSSAGMQVLVGGTLYTLVMLDFDGDSGYNVAVPWLSSTNGSNIYTINATAHGQSIGDPVQLFYPASVSDVTLYPGTYLISSVPNANQVRITVAGTTAGSTDTGGEPPLLETAAGDGTTTNVEVTLPGHGKVAGDTFMVQSDINSEDASVILGTLPVGEYLVRDPVTANSFWIQSPVPIQQGQSEYECTFGASAGNLFAFQRDWPGTDLNWFVDNFGTQMAVFCYANGPLLQWQPPVTLNRGAEDVTNAPTMNAGMLVAMPQAQVICWGAETNGLQDPLLLRWCDAAVITTWTASITNQAGSFRLSRGSRIVGARQVPQLTLVWTDIELWGMQYIGPPLIYSFTIMAAGCGLIAPRAHAVLNNTTYWMSQKQFFSFGAGGGSGAQVIPCTVWDFIFDDLDENEKEFIFAAPNSSFTEVSWFFRSASTGNIHYVKFNTNDSVWDCGTTLDRTAWMDQSILGPPVSTDEDLTVQQQETGYDDDTAAMSGVFAETGYAEIAEGDTIVYIDEIIPDLKWFGTGGYVTLTFWTVNYPSDNPVMHGPYVVTPTTRFIRLDCRARQVAFRIDWGAASGFSARLGAIKLRTRAAGRIP